MAAEDVYECEGEVSKTSAETERGYVLTLEPSAVLVNECRFTLRFSRSAAVGGLCGMV
jgi:hypothetical protein